MEDPVAQLSPLPLQGHLDVADLAERLTSVRISRSKRHTGLITPASTVRPQGRRRIDQADDDSGEDEVQPVQGDDNDKENQGQPGRPSVTPTRMNMVQEELSCSICLELCARPCTTPCGHNFCRSCLRESLKHNHRCPKCRKALPPRFDLTINTTLWNTIQLLFPATKSAPITPPASLRSSLTDQQQQQHSSFGAAPRIVSGLMRPWPLNRNAAPAASASRLDELLQRIEQGPSQPMATPQGPFHQRQSSDPASRPSLFQISASSFYSVRQQDSQPQLPGSPDTVHASQHLHQVLRPIATRPRSGDINEASPDGPRPDSAPHPFVDGAPRATGQAPPHRRSSPGDFAEGFGPWPGHVAGRAAGPASGASPFAAASQLPMPSAQQGRNMSFVPAAGAAPPMAVAGLSLGVGRGMQQFPRPETVPVTALLPAPGHGTSTGRPPMPPNAGWMAMPPSTSTRAPTVPPPAPRSTAGAGNIFVRAAPTAVSQHSVLARTMSDTPIYSPRQQQRRAQAIAAAPWPAAPAFSNSQRDQGRCRVSCPGAGPVREHYLRPSYLPDTLADQQEWPLRRQGRQGVSDDTLASSHGNTDQQQQLEPGPLMGLPVSRAERRRTRHSFGTGVHLPPAPTIRTAVSMGSHGAAAPIHGVGESFAPGSVPVFPLDGDSSDDGGDQDASDTEAAGSGHEEVECSLYPLLSGSFDPTGNPMAHEDRSSAEHIAATCEQRCDQASGEPSTRSPRSDLGLAARCLRGERRASRGRFGKASFVEEASAACSGEAAHVVQDNEQDEEQDVAASYGELLMYSLHDADTLECSPTQPPAKVGPLLWDQQLQQQVAHTTRTGQVPAAAAAADDAVVGSLLDSYKPACATKMHVSGTKSDLSEGCGQGSLLLGLGSAEHPIQLLSDEDDDVGGSNGAGQRHTAHADACGRIGAQQVAPRGVVSSGAGPSSLRVAGAGASRRVVAGLRRVKH